MGKTCSFENMYLALGHFQRLFYCVYSHWFTSAFQFPDIFHDVYFNKFRVKPLFSIIFCYKWHCLDESWSLSETTPWDFWGAIQGMGRVKPLPEVQSFSFFPNSSQNHMAAPSQLLVKAQDEIKELQCGVKGAKISGFSFCLRCWGK